MPDFFIVGHPKSGTTALYEMLTRHRGVFMSALKEPLYLADDLRPRFAPPRSASPPETLEDYMALFASADEGQLTGEASSFYLFSTTAAARIAALRPDARIIAILREPASFLRSLHLQLLNTHVESKRDLRAAIAAEGARREGRGIPRRSPRPQLLMYSDHVRYVEQLSRYRSQFPPEQILVLIYEDFRSDNERTIREVVRFLGLDQSFPLEVVEANPTVTRMRSQQLDEFLNMVSVGRGPVSRTLKKALKSLTSGRLRRAAIALTQRHFVYGSPPPPDPQLMLELRGRFRGEVEALGAYLNRDLLSLWGYE